MARRAKTTHRTQRRRGREEDERDARGCQTRARRMVQKSKRTTRQNDRKQSINQQVSSQL